MPQKKNYTRFTVDDRGQPSLLDRRCTLVRGASVHTRSRGTTKKQTGELRKNKHKRHQIWSKIEAQIWSNIEAQIWSNIEVGGRSWRACACEITDNLQAWSRRKTSERRCCGHTCVGRLQCEPRRWTPLVRLGCCFHCYAARDPCTVAMPPLERTMRQSGKVGERSAKKKKSGFCLK